MSVIYDDGRHYIRTLPEDAKFDVITSDPIDPWVKGSAALNTDRILRNVQKTSEAGRRDESVDASVRKQPRFGQEHDRNILSGLSQRFDFQQR